MSATQHSIRPFGPFDLHTVGNADTSVAFVASASAYVHSLRLAGRELLLPYADGRELHRNPDTRNLSLLPFPNRLARGSYTWEGQTLHFPVNDWKAQSALHGFANQAYFDIARLDLSTEHAVIALRYFHISEEHPAAYPFNVLFELALSLDFTKPAFRWQLTATNLQHRGDVPVGTGWHPYFALPGGHQQWRITMPPNQSVELQASLPTGKCGDGVPAGRPVLIDTAWDSCFALTDPQHESTVRLSGPDYSLALRQFGDLRYTQLYVPPAANAVAIEPMSCNVNAFSSAPEEVRLSANASRTLGMEVLLDRV